MQSCQNNFFKEDCLRFFIFLTSFNKQIKFFIAIILFITAIFINSGDFLFAYENDFKEEFNELCGNTDIAMTLPVEKLEKLVKRCDNLMDKIKATEHLTKKTYLYRLEKCRNLYKFMIDSK